LRIARPQALRIPSADIQAMARSSCSCRRNTLMTIGERAAGPVLGRLRYAQGQFLTLA
jgi:hypothetical protein